MKKTISLLALTAIAVASSALAAPKPIFNGKDLTGWVGEGYVVEDGAITCTPKGHTLRTAKGYTDYILELEYKLPPGGNNGIGIHYLGTGSPSAEGMEIQVLDNSSKNYAKLKDNQFNGSIYHLQAAKKGFLKPVGEWNKQKITVQGDVVIVELNGEVINKANLVEIAKNNRNYRGPKRRSGYICFCGHGSKVQFKNITLDELESGKDRFVDYAQLTPPADLEGFTAVYNKRDLQGFIYSVGDLDHWQPKGHAIHYDGKSTAKDKNLWIEKEYADFELYCDWRWAAPALSQADHPVLLPSGLAKKGADGKPITVRVDDYDSGIYLRGSSKSQINIWNWPCGSGEVYGYRTDGDQPAAIRAGATPSAKADKPAGEWNRFKITLKGDQLTVILNGQEVISKAQLPGMPKSGRIGFQHHGSPIDFTNIYIKELK